MSEEAVLKIIEGKYDSLRPAIKDKLSQGMNNVNDFQHLYSSEEANLLDSVITDYKTRNNLRIALITFDSIMTSLDSVEAVTQIIGIKNRINTTIGISIAAKTIFIWNDSLMNQTVLKQYESKAIIDSSIIPFFKRDDYFTGTLNGLTAIAKKVEENTRVKF